ncbi:MAG: DNA methylase, partial [Candidatus Thiodiazotropha sp. (ex Semelilucina semeliformis)]|nr:DNA methylase [Candidatus Thiodiazotropha sp. (ex Semelilucina semeliformis)]
VLTDPPYLVNYQDRSGRKIANDNNDTWVAPVFDELYRVLKDNSICITFCALPSIVSFMGAAQTSGFRSLGQLIWPKRYASSSYHLAFKHEQALVFAKGRPDKPDHALPTIQEWRYSGNELHPTQKHTDILIPLIEQYTELGDVILDPFCGSGSTLVAANQIHRHYIGMELSSNYIEAARQRLELQP